jgi:hypothetical protein
MNAADHLGSRDTHRRAREVRRAQMECAGIRKAIFSVEMAMCLLWWKCGISAILNDCVCSARPRLSGSAGNLSHESRD